MKNFRDQPVTWAKKNDAQVHFEKKRSPAKQRRPEILSEQTAIHQGTRRRTETK